MIVAANTTAKAAVKAVGRTYAVRAVRWVHGWELHVDGIGVTQVRTLDHAEQQVRDLIATELDLDDSAVVTAHIEIRPDLGELNQRIDRARHDTEDAAVAQVQAAQQARDLVADLRSLGLSVSDTATILGISRGRVSQLTTRESADRSAGGPGPHTSVDEIHAALRHRGYPDPIDTDLAAAIVGKWGLASTSITDSATTEDGGSDVGGGGRAVALQRVAEALSAAQVTAYAAEHDLPVRSTPSRSSNSMTTPAQVLTEPTARQARPVDPDQYALAVDGAQTMLFDQPAPCPVLPGLVLDGVAVDPAGRHHLALTLRRDDQVVIRVHLGPDEAMIARRGLIIVTALRSHGDLDGPEHSIAILTWLATCWATFHEELTP